MSSSIPGDRQWGPDECRQRLFPPWQKKEPTCPALSGGGGGGLRLGKSEAVCVCGVHVDMIQIREWRGHNTQSINQSINSILYSASPYARSRFTESRVQSSHSYTVIPVVVSHSYSSTMHRVKTTGDRTSSFTFIVGVIRYISWLYIIILLLTRSLLNMGSFVSYLPPLTAFSVTARRFFSGKKTTWARTN